MSTRRHGNALIALLGLGAADLAVLNQWALPALLSVTDVSAATDHAARPSTPPPTAALALASPAASTAAQVPVSPAPPVAVAGDDDSANPSAIVRFRSGTWWVGPRGRKTLASTLTQLAATNYWIEVSGHADPMGTDRINQRISQARATAVAALLVRSGVDPGRIRIQAFGERHPSSTGRHRRVEITIRGAP